MPDDINSETNQTPKTINLPNDSGSVEKPPAQGNNDQPGQQPDEHVPPVEVPGRRETPEHVPEKGVRA